MTDMQQILAGMNELNVRVQNAEAREDKLDDEIKLAGLEIGTGGA